MLVFCCLAAIAVPAATVAALPFSQSSLGCYPKTKHTLPLFRSLPPAIGNFEGEITIGSQTVRVMLDTGSSDAWFLPQDFQCLDPITLKPAPSEVCGFRDSKLIPGPSFQEIPNIHLNTSYAATSNIIGPVGYDNISFAGIEVPKQEIALAKTIAASYDGNVTGVLGLAYPSLTSVFSGNDPLKDVPCKDTVGANNTGCNQQHTSPLLTTIFANNLTPPVFSLALSRGTPNAGVMAVGGLPDLRDPRVNVSKGGAEATVPIEKLNGTQNYSLYLTGVDGFHFAGATSGASKGQYFVDSGYVGTVIDKEDAEAVSKLFDPPAWYNETLASYIVQCDAVAPEFAVEIAGCTFEFNRKDLILDGGDKYPHCSTGVQAKAGAGSPGVLGSVFLRNTLAVFDIGKEEMTFASRVHYRE